MLTRPTSQAAAIGDATTWDDLREIVRAMWERIVRIDDELALRQIDREGLEP